MTCTLLLFLTDLQLVHVDQNKSGPCFFGKYSFILKVNVEIDFEPGEVGLTYFQITNLDF